MRSWTLKINFPFALFVTRQTTMFPSEISREECIIGIAKPANNFQSNIFFSPSNFVDTGVKSASSVKTENETCTTKSTTTTSSGLFGVTYTTPIFGSKTFASLSSTSTKATTAKKGFSFAALGTSATSNATNTFGTFEYTPSGNPSVSSTTSTSTETTSSDVVASCQFNNDRVILRPNKSSFGQPFVIDEIVKMRAETRVIGQLGIAMSSHVWRISNFGALCDSSDEHAYTSPLFELGTRGQAKPCKMFLYPSGNSALCKDYTSIFIECQNNVNGEAQICFSILNDKMQIKYQAFSSDLMSADVQLTKIGCSQFVRKDFLLDPDNGLLSNDTLTLMCHVSLRSMEVMPIVPMELMKINSDFGQLLESEKFSDLTLEVEDKEFRVHKPILAARSPTFRAMLEDNGEQTILKLTDIRYEVMKQILRFIYTEKVDGLNEVASELLDAAHRFKLEDLKTLCEHSLLKNLNVANAVDAHVMAEKYEANWLKKRTTDFIIEHAQNVINTLGYKNLAESHPRLLDELFCEMVRRKVIHPIETPVSSL